MDEIELAAADVVSIHIPRVGDDQLLDASTAMAKTVSIHIPRVGDDQSQVG